MKVSPLIAAAVIGAMFTVQGWTLLEVVNLKVEVSTLKVKLENAVQVPQSYLKATVK